MPLKRSLCVLLINSPIERLVHVLMVFGEFTLSVDVAFLCHESQALFLALSHFPAPVQPTLAMSFL